MATLEGKQFFSYAHIHKIVESTRKQCQEFNPDIIIAIGGGGCIPARILRTVLNIPILTVSIELYNDATNSMNETIKNQQWFDESYGSGQFVRNKRVLVVDEVDDTRTTLAYVVEELRRRNGPAAIATMVVHNKKKDKKKALAADVLYISGSDVEDVWICYPWDAFKYDLSIEHHEHLDQEVLKL